MIILLLTTSHGIGWLLFFITVVYNYRKLIHPQGKWLRVAALSFLPLLTGRYIFFKGGLHDITRSKEIITSTAAADFPAYVHKANLAWEANPLLYLLALAALIMLFMQRKWLRFSLSLLCLLSFIIAKLTLPFLAEVYDSAIVPLILFPVIDLFSEKKANKTTIAVVMVIFISVFFYRLCSISDAAREVRIKINLIERLIGNFRDTYGDKFLLRDENSFQLILPTLRYTEVSIEGLFYSSMASPDSAVLLITREDFEGYLSLPKIPLDSVGDVMNLSTVAYLLFEREYPKKYYKYFTGYRNLNPQYFSLDTSAIRWGNTDKRNDLAYLEQNIRIGIAEEDTLKTMPCRKKMISLLIENRGAVALYSGRENAHIRFRILDRTDSLRWDAGVMLLEADVYKQYKQVFFAGIPCETDTFRLEVDLVQDGCPLGIGDSALLISSWQISR